MQKCIKNDNLNKKSWSLKEVNIFDFKHLASSGNKNKANKIDIKEINGFTFVEVILVMALISFLYIVTMKVIQHNIDQKVPVYVYNLYKNLDNESKILTKKLIEEANSSEGGGSGSNSNKKTIDDVLKGMDAKTYCQAFANDANLIGDADCENSIKNIETSKSESKSLTYNCQRTYTFNVYSDGKYNETFTPSYDANLPKCKDNQNFDDDTISCNAKPTEKIANLMLDNTQNYHTYTCGNKSETVDNNETKPDVAAFSIDTKQKIQKSLKTTNNVHLNFVTLKPGNNKYSITYNLAANVNQDEICPKVERVNLDISNIKYSTKTSYKSPTTITTYAYKYYDTLSQSICYLNSQYCLKKINNYCKSSTARNNSSVTPEKEIDSSDYSYTLKYKGLLGFKRSNNPKCKVNPVNTFNVATCEVTSKYTTPDTGGLTDCASYISYANNIKNTNTPFKITETTKPCKITIDANDGDYYGDLRGKTIHWEATAQIQNIKFTNQTDIGKYYDKWNAFFNTQENGKHIFSKATKAAISSQTKNEGDVKNTLDKISNNYLAHFIYAAIDTSFEKGEMGKNIFVFEQFGSKIIPVGYLANNQNTPLKFNVITRNPNSFKIEKMNEKPLTFCEAMKYTGEKFSQYCGCKDANDKIVTQYTKIATCDNKFGCIIRPVQPSSVK